MISGFTKKSIITLIIICNAISCVTKQDYLNGRTLIARSEDDQSSIFDSNGDGSPDIERWYRGSGITFEKLDTDFNGYWDVQGERYPSGKFRTHIIYPKNKYSVIYHHIFHATEFYPVDKTILARP